MLDFEMVRGGRKRERRIAVKFRPIKTQNTRLPPASCRCKDMEKSEEMRAGEIDLIAAVNI